MNKADQYALALEQGSLFVDAPHLRAAMTDAAAFLRSQDAGKQEAEIERLRRLLSTAPQPLMHPNAEWCEIYERWARKAWRAANYPHLSTPNDEAGIKPASQPSTPNDE